MTTEEKVFRRRRFLPERMERFGFRKTENGYEYTADFLNGEFRAILTVTGAGDVRGSVIDCMNNEEYTPLRAESFNGAYVNSVRNAYEELLTAVAEQCCRDVLFVSDQANRIADRILERYAVQPDFPWDQGRYRGSGTFRHTENRKWFALIMNIRLGALLKNACEEPADVMNLKADPQASEALCKRAGIFPAYHMNHKNWISVVLNDLLPDEDVMQLVDASFRLTEPRAAACGPLGTKSRSGRKEETCTRKPNG